MLLTKRRLSALVAAGFYHVQFSFQGPDPGNADRIAGLGHAHEKKLAAAALHPRRSGLPLTLNAVMHRQNLDRLPELIELAVRARRAAARSGACAGLWLGVAQPPRAVPDPTRQLERATEFIVEVGADAAQGHSHHRLCRAGLLRAPAQGLHGRLGAAVHQHFAGGQGPAMPRRRNPARAPPRWPSAHPTASLREVWLNHSEAFNRYRGTAWMPEPCRSCDPGARSIGAAAAARLSPSPAMRRAPPTRPAPWRRCTSRSSSMAEAEAAADNNRFIYRNFAGGTLEADGDHGA